MKKKPTVTSRNYFQKVLPFIFIGLGLFVGWLGLQIGFHYNNLIWKAVDSLFMSLVLTTRTAHITVVMEAVSWWGYFGTMIVWILLAVMTYRKRDRLSLAMIIVLAFSGWLIGLGLKNYFYRDRPFDHALVAETLQSFPSNHALTSTLLYVTLSYFSYHFSHKFWKAMAVFFVSLFLIFLISFSRIYLGVHYLSDVCGGFLLGLGIFFVVLGSFKIIGLRRG